MMLLKCRNDKNNPMALKQSGCFYLLLAGLKAQPFSPE